MAKRILIIAGAAIYLLSFVVGAVVYFSTEGSFSPASGYFWAYTALPLPMLLLHLAAGVLLLRKPDRAAPAAVAVEVMVFVAAAVGAILFWTTWRWLLLLGVLRAAFGGVALWYLWAPFDRDRVLLAAGGGAGLLLALVWVPTLLPAGDGARPLLPPGKVLTVWKVPKDPESEGTEFLKAGVALAGGGRVVVDERLPKVEIRLADCTVSVLPMSSLRRVSTDGFWTTRLNAMTLVFDTGGVITTWGGPPYVCARVQYNTPRPSHSWIAAAAAREALGSGDVRAEYYARVDAAADSVEIVSLLRLERAICVHQSRFFELTLEPHAGQRIRLPSLGDVSLSAADPAPRLVNAQPGRVVLYKSRRGPSGPFDEVSRVERFGDAMVIEGVAGDRALLIYAPDWQGQALRQVSPAAGEPLCANMLGLQFRPAAGSGRGDQLAVVASVAATDVGRGSPVVRMEPGVYVNRMVLRLVPRQEDYSQLLSGLSLWQPPTD